MYVVGKMKGARGGQERNLPIKPIKKRQHNLPNLPIKKRPCRQSSQSSQARPDSAAAAATAAVKAAGQQPRTVSPAKTPSKVVPKVSNPYLRGARDQGAGNKTVDNTMTPNQVLMALGRGCAIAGCQVKNCYGKLCLKGTGMCPVCGEKGKCPAVKTGKYNQCGNIVKFGHRMNDAVKSYGFCTRCLAPWRFGTHHTQGKDDDCVIHSRLQRIVLEKKPPRQSLEGFVTSIVSSPGSYNEFLCTVVAPMVTEKEKCLNEIRKKGKKS
ncbi:hypothetical protein THAOC_15550 [Thalassiosira oceanica]|uniref:Uncharacterized protein n=1 Tax=Thalassiosira oceanica TaxID=159749 RepID=K0SRW7_THAOC|nr:hypothetical protein THAOC_15550 [Thalassiosira oceanica]|eukprot:EJK63776.1 hypothetical protein THAOC_15550 [Thalassiosira oceanica]